MAIALVQKTTAGTFQGNSGSGGNSLTISTPHFTSNTTAGSTLIAVVSAIDAGFSFSSITFTMSGVTWTAVGMSQAEPFTIGAFSGNWSGIAVFYAVNVSSISSATTGTATISGNIGSSILGDVELYEYSGVNAVDASMSGSTTLSPNFSQELIFVAGSGVSGSNQTGTWSAASGYTLSNATFDSSAFGGSQTYFLNCAQQYVLSSAASGSQSVNFGVSGGQILSAVSFRIAAPTVTSCTPSSGTTAGGTSITNLAGTGFVSTPTVTFGGGSATSVAFTSSTQLTCTTPAHAAGLVAVTVTNPDGQSATASVYTYTTAGGAIRLLCLLGAGT